MAELLDIKEEVEEFRKEYLSKHSQAEEDRMKENQAAIRIQKWIRVWRVRASVIHLRKKAVIIQKIWRGFRARARFRQMVKAAYLIMKMNFYGEMAVKIQCLWRGFFVRKYIHNFYVRKRYLEGISRKNEFIRRELDELAELQKRERDCLQMLEEQTAKFYLAHRLHYLLSTKQCPGVFNSPFRPAPHEMEQLLRQVKYQAPTRLTNRGRVCLLGRPEPPASSFSGSLGAPSVETMRICSFSRHILPPIADKQKQGPIGTPCEVREQHVHCPDPMLNLQTLSNTSGGGSPESATTTGIHKTP